MATQLDAKDTQKEITPSREIFTSRKHSMDYFTTDGVILRTGYKNKLDWYLLPLREMLDNSADFLWKYYKGFDNARIDISIRMTDEVFYLSLRNSNPASIPLFSNLKEIFDYDMRYGSKQDVHIISRGMLGDAMKQVLSLGYVLLHVGDDGTAFTDKQWKVPLIVRHNRKQAEIYLTVDKAAQTWNVEVIHSEESLPHTDTEIKIQLPVIDEVRDSLDRKYIAAFCRKYSLLTTDISFKFQIIDDITHKPEQDNIDNTDTDIDTLQDLTKVLSTVPEKGILTIDVQAIHPIAADWKNSDFIHSYKAEEFKSRITNVHDKTKKVYEVLQQFREGTNMPKTSETELTIAELLDRPDRDKIIKRLFDKLHKTLDAPSELSLPYTTNPKKRCDMLVERIGKLYDIDTNKKPAYQLVRGLYTDRNISTLQYPVAFEIIAIPFKEPYGPRVNWKRPKAQEFIGAVNYSMSPKDNIFEGDYPYVRSGFYASPRDIKGVLRQCGFEDYGAAKNRLPCIIIGNVITPRRDPQGYDKSSIDTTPFVKIIVDGVQRITPKIQTYRAVGYTFHGRDDEDITRHENNKKIDATELLRQFLIKERGLPK